MFDFSILSDPKFASVVAHYERACEASRLHRDMSKMAFDYYGNHGPQISGCVRDHFPEQIKNDLRNLARRVSDEMVKAKAARPKRTRLMTVARIGRLVATRDGVGFYGPAPFTKGI